MENVPKNQDMEPYERPMKIKRKLLTNKKNVEIEKWGLDQVKKKHSYRNEHGFNHNSLETRRLSKLLN